MHARLRVQLDQQGGLVLGQLLQSVYELGAGKAPLG
jgi:hypothetical protein